MPFDRTAFAATLLASAAALFAAEPALEAIPAAPPAAPAAPAAHAPQAQQADRLIFFEPIEAGKVESAPRVMFLRGAQPATRRFVAGPGNADVLIAPGQARTFNVELKKVAYLGVSTSPVPAALAAQLKLPEGFGLVVDHVEPKGPADAAGLKQHDVVVRVGDQKLVNAAQLGTLVRGQKPGDEIELVVIRQGKEAKLKAKLIEKEVPVPPAGAEVLPFGAEPFEFQWEPGQRVPAPGPGAPGAPGALPRIKRFDIDMLKPRGVQRYSDEEHDLEIKQDGDARKLIVKDKAGKTVFDGPIGTDEQRKAVPEAVKPKLEKLEKSSRFQWRGAAPGAAGGAGAIELDLDFAGPEVEKMIELHLKQLEDLPGLDRQELQKQIDAMRKQMDDMRKQMDKHRADLVPGALPIPGGPGVPNLPGQQFEHRAATSSAMASMSDDQHSITYKLDEKGKHLIAKDKEGKVLFDGPINTDEERVKVPAEIKAKLDKLENSVRVNQNFEFRGAPARRFRNQPEDPESKDRPREDRKEEQQREKPVL